MPNLSTSLKNTFLSAIILSVANMGDAFLYAWLPANYQLLGISSFWVGVLLSVNRMSRLFLNGWVAWYVSKWGLKIIFITAAIIASITTITYGIISSIPIWLAVRFLWGISFSALRLGNTLLALQYYRRGFALGLSRSLIELGPVTALLAGPLLLEFAGSRNTFILFGAFNIGAVLLASALSYVKTENVLKKELLLSKPAAFNILVLINAFTIEGLLVVLLVKLLTIESISNYNVFALTGLLLGYRRLSIVMLSPLSGWLSDKYGFKKVFIYTTLACASSLFFILAGQIIFGIVVAFTFGAMNAATSTGVAIGTANSFIKEVSDNATWRDLGSAAGTFAGALLLPAENLNPYIITLIMLYVTTLLYYRRILMLRKLFNVRLF